jgi:hypothetical protein
MICPDQPRSVHHAVTKELFEATAIEVAMMTDLKQQYDAPTVAVMRQTPAELICVQRIKV